jgi:hypothetical protein
VESLAAAGSLLAGVLTLTVRVLLLLTGLVAAALLLSGLLVRILVLLARLLVATEPAFTRMQQLCGEPTLRLQRISAVQGLSAAAPAVAAHGSRC